ncbi:hypothetical protein DPEC_G00134580 [Dallia pectoralis]|uniref:Uncharacterized protein n=1 Tax=Dallia pectoralis TaxID=75939 RepID=A0ACC2GRS6_DALPE|nr:hypothetical protein DPEC_G00134580 [Dallia pectoralis]
MAQLDEPVEDQGIDNAAFIGEPARCPALPLSALEEGEETCMVVGEGGLETPHSAGSVASLRFRHDSVQLQQPLYGRRLPKSPGIFSLEELPKEDKDQSVIQELAAISSAAAPARLNHSSPARGQHYMHCVMLMQSWETKNDVKPLDTVLFVAPQHPGGPCDTQPPYYSIICDNTENSPSGNT